MKTRYLKIETPHPKKKQTCQLLMYEDKILEKNRHDTDVWRQDIWKKKTGMIYTDVWRQDAWNKLTWQIHYLHYFELKHVTWKTALIREIQTPNTVFFLMSMPSIYHIYLRCWTLFCKYIDLYQYIAELPT